jgi:hypothetical protein
LVDEERKARKETPEVDLSFLDDLGDRTGFKKEEIV